MRKKIERKYSDVFVYCRPDGNCWKYWVKKRVVGYWIWFITSRKNHFEEKVARS